MRKITETMIDVGVEDRAIDLFEGQYKVQEGMLYNSYVILDEKIAVLDTVDKNFKEEWLKNIQEALNGRDPTYLIVQHMEPDHSANIQAFLEVYPECMVVGNAKTFVMMKQFFHQEWKHILIVKDMDTLDLGKHHLTFVFAPMVHWPEVMVTYESEEKVLFSADAFGKFGASRSVENWDDEARRYYIGIVGKYGLQVQNLLKKASSLDIQKILPLHGPILEEHLEYYLSLYQIWSSYQAEQEGIVIAYTSIYGNTKEAALLLEKELKEKGYKNIKVFDLARDDMSEAIAYAFAYSKLVLASPTYNTTIFPFMNTFIEGLIERNFQNRTVAFIENGSWAPMATKVMKDKLSSLKNLTFIEPGIKILSSLSEENRKEIKELTLHLL